MAIQILFWFVSGLFFAIAPIETVRSEHRIAELPIQPVSLSTAAIGLQRIAGSPAAAADKIELRTLLDKPVALVHNGDARHRLNTLSPGQQISPIPPSLAETGRADGW